MEYQVNKVNFISYLSIAKICCTFLATGQTLQSQTDSIILAKAQWFPSTKYQDCSKPLNLLQQIGT